MATPENPLEVGGWKGSFFAGGMWIFVGGENTGGESLILFASGERDFCGIHMPL